MSFEPGKPQSSALGSMFEDELLVTISSMKTLCVVLSREKWVQDCICLYTFFLYYSIVQVIVLSFPICRVFSRDGYILLYFGI